MVSLNVSRVVKVRFLYKVFLPILLIFCFLMSSVSSAISAKDAAQITGSGTQYYVSNSGNDNNDGLSESTPWKTLEKVNSFNFQPGDKILFKSGDTWRGQLVPRSGTAAGRITYTSYGIGNKPLLLGSVEKNNVSDWMYEGNNIWSVKPPSLGEELLLNPSVDKDLSSWWSYFNSSSGAKGSLSRDTVNYDTAPASLKIQTVNNGSGASDIQLYTANISIVKNKTYKLSFRAKATSDFKISYIALHKKVSPWTTYAANYYGPSITTNWQTYNVFFTSNTTANDARITFYLGDVLPDGAVLNIDTLNFKELSGETLGFDVGNIIFNNGEAVGIKVWNEADLDKQNEFWYDRNNMNVKVYSTQNPALLYKDIELALRRTIINQSNKRYVTYDGLALSYGAAHGIGGTKTHHITVQNCDISFIGGGDQYGGIPPGRTQPVRFGNGIEFWESAHDNVVKNNRIWEIYDAALTNQGSNKNSQYNIYYTSNIIWNSEYSFEIWNRPSQSTMYNIYFENNKASNAGYGWGHTQRPDPSGRHIMFYSSTAAIPTGICIRKNIFEQAAGSAIATYAPLPDKHKVIIDYNTYYQKEGSIIAYWFGKKYSTVSSDILKYKSDTGKDKSSKIIVTPTP